ncbi:DUF6809 family protein [Hydrogenoanaerobacterium saccharovorans]|uniref:DUF6809 family protein n=1 Tax=Hydrogenoanaerobacterium saccharovorans TaxID=474960 RepID=UPI0031F709F5
MERKLLRALYDCFYTRPRFDEQENEVEECHKALIEALAKPERKLVLRIIDAQDYIKTETSLDSFIAGFELAWRLFNELHYDDEERSALGATRKAAVDFTTEAKGFHQG